KLFLKGTATAKHIREITDNIKYLVATPHQKRSINVIIIWISVLPLLVTLALRTIIKCVNIGLAAVNDNSQKKTSRKLIASYSIFLFPLFVASPLLFRCQRFS